MISISKYFSETANVGPSTIPIAPFGIIDPRKENLRRLANVQDIILKDPVEQKKRIEKILK